MDENIKVLEEEIIEDKVSIKDRIIGFHNSKIGRGIEIVTGLAVSFCLGVIKGTKDSHIYIETVDGIDYNDDVVEEVSE